MKKVQFTRSILTVMAGSLLISSAAFADNPSEDLVAMGESAISISEQSDQAVVNVKNEASNKMNKVTADTNLLQDDAYLTGKVKDKLNKQKDLQKVHILVNTKDSAVTLSGYVHNAEQAVQAVLAASKVEGVRKVNDEIDVIADVKTAATKYAHRSKLSAEVTAGLLADKSIPVKSIKVRTVSKGVVHLSGEVKTEAEKAQAETIAKAVKGVTSVENKIVVTP